MYHRIYNSKEDNSWRQAIVDYEHMRCGAWQWIFMFTVYIHASMYLLCIIWWVLGLEERETRWRIYERTAKDSTKEEGKRPWFEGEERPQDVPRVDSVRSQTIDRVHASSSYIKVEEVTKRGMERRSEIALVTQERNPRESRSFNWARSNPRDIIIHAIYSMSNHSIY